MAGTMGMMTQPMQQPSRQPVPMQITVFGTGYVGLVTGACLAEVGNDVVCVDIAADRVAKLNSGEVPFFEPGLLELVERNHTAGRLRFITDEKRAIAHGRIFFIAVGTPPSNDGSADLSHVLEVARSIGQHLQGDAVIVSKSTVPVGTADRIKRLIAEELCARSVQIPFLVVSSPEFLKEGDAIKDCMQPDRIIIGTDSPLAVELLKELYLPFSRSHERILVMDVRSAELTKYVANAMLAAKISLMNEVANIAEHVGADVELVRQGIGSDSRIGYSFISPGAGYGGSCLSKDVQALEWTARHCGYKPLILPAVEEVNRAQKLRLFELLKGYFGSLAGRKVAVWGLAFKPNTDDMREAPSRVLLQQLFAAGSTVRAHDPHAHHQAQLFYGARPELVLCPDPFSALQDADCLVVVTEWMAFCNPDLAKIRASLRIPVIFDGRNIYDPATVEAAGIAYYGIGRGRSVVRPEHR